MSEPGNMTLNEIKGLLASHQIQLTRSLGQNFLHDGNQLRRIVRLARLEPSDRVLEIGPGLGPLTERLLENAGAVLAIEKDARLVAVLEKRFATALGSKQLTLLHGDALDHLRRPGQDWSGWKLVANLPYSVASPILVELALLERGPALIVATLQAEVARRIMSQAGDDDYGLLTLLLQWCYQPESSFRIPAGCFFPEPAVESVCICLTRRAEPVFHGAPEHYVRVVKTAFSQRRKTMLKLLKYAYPGAPLPDIFAELKIPGNARAESVTLPQFAALAERLAGHAPQ